MIEARLQDLGISLPSQPPPAANYVPFVKVGSLLFISGQLPSWNGELKYIGKIGRDFSIEEGQEAARICALNILAHLKIACEKNFTHVARCVRLGGFVNATDEFKEHPQVMNGASDLMFAVFEAQGRHTRATVGVSSLPFGAAVEVDAIFELMV